MGNERTKRLSRNRSLKELVTIESTGVQRFPVEAFLESDEAEEIFNSIDRIREYQEQKEHHSEKRSVK